MLKMRAITVDLTISQYLIWCYKSVFYSNSIIGHGVPGIISITLFTTK